VVGIAEERGAEYRPTQDRANILAAEDLIIFRLLYYLADCLD
jgi:hypothetical protein